MRNILRIAVLASTLMLLPCLTRAASLDFEEAIREGRWPHFIRELKAKKVAIEYLYEPGSEREIELKPDQAAQLDFVENSAGIKEFLFWNDGGRLLVIIGCSDEQYADYSASILTPEDPEDYRISSSSGAAATMECTTRWHAMGEKGTVAFRAILLSRETFERKMKEWREKRLNALRRTLRWDREQEVAPFEILMDNPDDPNMARLRTDYRLEELVARAADGYERLQIVLKWAHDMWDHSGDNKPSKSDPISILEEASQGKRFRCVEYSIVVAAAARALGMPSRVLALKRPDVETAESGAGHVVAEVWLDQFDKWVLADGQMDAIPERKGIPLNAVEFQDALAQNVQNLRVKSSSGTDLESYVLFVGPYLFYFDFNVDQRFFGEDYEKRRYEPVKGKIMLVPKGAKNPTVFQKRMPIKNCTYISNPDAFYPDMARVDEGTTD